MNTRNTATMAPTPIRADTWLGPNPPDEALLESVAEKSVAFRPTVAEVAIVFTATTGPSTIHSTPASTWRSARRLLSTMTPSTRATWAPSSKLRRSRPPPRRPKRSMVTIAEGASRTRTIRGSPNPRGRRTMRMIARPKIMTSPSLLISHGTEAPVIRQNTSLAAT